MSIVTLLRPGQRAQTARVTTSACRGYVVELDPDNDDSARMLTDLRGNVVHFRSLNAVQDALRDRGVREATLVQQLACEEVSALGISTREESGIAVLDESDSERK